MNKKALFDVVKHPKELLIKINYRYPQMLSWMSDEKCLQFWYRYRFGKKLNLQQPKTFNEKVQWLKINDRDPLYTTMVDKYEAKEYVASIIGDEYIIPTLGIWDKFEDIDFDKLPNQFVLKCTHDSGGLVVCKDKKTFDINAARKRINRSLKRNFYWVGREWPYKDVPPRIIAEKYMENSDGQAELSDYKFYCFNGKPKYCHVISDRSQNETMDFFDMDWKLQPFTKTKTDDTVYPHGVDVKKPEHFEDMKRVACMLSQKAKMVRVDLYEINGKVYFGEITFFPNSGLFNKFSPDVWDKKLGDMIAL